MRATAEELRINVGLATRDRDEMIYLESVRYNRKVSLRNVVAGLRVPIELTSLGRAYLAAVPNAEREEIMSHLRARRAGEWKKLEAESRNMKKCRCEGTARHRGNRGNRQGLTACIRRLSFTY